MTIKFYYYSAFHTSDVNAIFLSFKSVGFMVTRKDIFDARIEQNALTKRGSIITEQQLRFPLRGQP